MRAYESQRVCFDPAQADKLESSGSVKELPKFKAHAISTATRHLLSPVVS